MNRHQRRKAAKSPWVKAREDLVVMGILRDSGRRKYISELGEWQTVWELTELGKARGRHIIDAHGHITIDGEGETKQ
jgi:hypothetical protein